MPYITQLTDRASVYRPSVSESETGQRKSVLTAASGLSSVTCKLIDAGQRRVQQLFGAEVTASCMVYFPAGTDIRPKIGSTDGQNDRLVITDSNGVDSKWMVERTKNPGSRDKLVVAAVVRNEF